MTREAFIKILDKKRYSYEIEGDKIIVTQDGNVYLSSLETIPSGVGFGNDGNVDLDSLETLPPGVEFKNLGDVGLKSIGGWFSIWKVNIKGIEPKRLLNKMIELGLFDKGR